MSVSTVTTREKPSRASLVRPIKDHPAKKHYAILDRSHIIFPALLGILFYRELKIFLMTLFRTNKIHPVTYKSTRLVGYYDYMVSKDGDWNATTVCHTILVICFVLSQMPPYANIIGLSMPTRPYQYAQRPKRRTFNSLKVCLVTKGTNVQTVLTSARQWEGLEHHKKLQFHVVVDDENSADFCRELPSFIKVITIPASFSTKQAKYKARALEFYRQREGLTAQDWVLHLDEESRIDAAVVKSCLDFIERGDEDMGMGTIYYNDKHHWTNAFLSCAEIIRIAEDFGRFQLPVRFFRRPLLGWMHGSWILINGAVENRVTWDTACVAEDFWFAYAAAGHGYKFGWLHAIVREQPAESFRDFFRQRRRWYTGILSVDSVIVKMALTMSVCGGVSFFILPVFALSGVKLLIPSWLFLWLLWNFVTDAYVLMVSSVLQDMTAPGITGVEMAGHALKSVVVAPFVYLVQAVALVSCVWEPAKGFDIIAKS